MKKTVRRILIGLFIGLLILLLVVSMFNIKSETDKIKFIKNNSHQGDQILILSNLAPELYLYTNTPRPLPIPGFTEIVFKSDMEKIYDFLDSIDRGFVYRRELVRWRHWRIE